MRIEVSVTTFIKLSNSYSRNPSHTSHTDPRPHATALLATEEQAARGKSQPIHIYHDEDLNYLGHALYEKGIIRRMIKLTPDPGNYMLIEPCACIS